MEQVQVREQSESSYIIVMLQCITLVFPMQGEVVRELIMLREKVEQLMRVSVP